MAFDPGFISESQIKTGDDIFECKMCGDCCRGFGGTYLSDQDILNISDFIGCDPETFTGQYCSKSGSRYVLTLSESGSCIFFDPEKACTIHPVKPNMCRAWPFIKTIVANPENWNAMAGSCPGMKKDVSHEILIAIVSHEIALREKNQK